MSWNLSFQATATDYDDRAGEALRAMVVPPEQKAKGADAIAFAVLAARSTVQSGTVGDATRSFNVSLSGHANEDHAPESGWANDCLTITVSQL